MGVSMRRWSRWFRIYSLLASALLSLGFATFVSVHSTAAGRHGRAPFVAVARPIDSELAKKMTGVSWRPGCPVPIDDLRLITMTFWGFDNRSHAGRLVVNKDVTQPVVRAFHAMYDAKFPIRRMELIEKYDANDDRSMEADNTSAFNCRNKTGSTTEFSVHSYGRAIDINPVENPYVKGEVVLPPTGRNYLDRDHVRPGMIVAGDMVTEAFTDEGFDWGGDWHSLKDYQHFECSS